MDYTSMDGNLTELAINLALNCKWDEAIKINKQILKLDETDVDAMNRLSRAYYESGDIKKAKKITNDVLKIESSNNIAKNALIKYNKSSTNSKSQDNIVNVSDFLEESGKTKQVNLLNIGRTKEVFCLDCGDEVLLSSHAHKVSITTLAGVYVGKLPDDLSAKIRRLVKAGYQFKVLIKSVNNNIVKIFIREIKRGKGMEKNQSFPRENSEAISELSS